jgi:hypothetical protein
MTEKKTPTITIRPADQKDDLFLIKISNGSATVNGDIKRHNIQVTKDGLSLRVEATSIDIVESSVATATRALIKQSGTSGVLTAEIPPTWNVSH